ncbi:peptidoglycan-binding domain-containing protein [Curtobacterium sp. B18]|uniref:peptidoglycan-binding domain-containing protein n=1 Tax=Curtobacterium sp. B18 TaxID=95614 RepID=UPI0011D296B5|nr:peptidoglycan-binding domain-containing protein [Curtobacterium sp. B18]
MSTTTTTDSKPVKVRVRMGSERLLSSGAEGVLTASECRDGQAIASGASSFSVDGDRLVNIATSSPLWRDIEYGAKGEDVRALQAELTRLGFPVYVDGVAGRNTARAVERLSLALNLNLTSNWKTEAPGEVLLPLSRYVWLPAERVNVSDCKAEVGEPVTSGGPLATASAQVETATVEGMKDLKIPGSRVLTLPDGSTLAVGDDGTVAEPDKLAEASGVEAEGTEGSSAGSDGGAASDDSSAADSDGSRTVTLPLGLKTPASLSVVPAGSIVFHGGTSCVRSTGNVVRVQVVGSKLGASVVFVSEKPGLGPNVDASPGRSLKC